MVQIMDLQALVTTAAQTTLAGKLRALMPAIDQRIKNGVSHKEIVNLLNRHGGLATEVKLKTFRSYLFRYRKKARGVQEPAAEKGGSASCAVRVAPVARTPVIRNASDLRRLRNEEVDLDALSRIGRNQRGG